MTQVSVSSILGVLHLLPIGIIVGIISALLGIGGGLLYVPALAAIGASPLQSVATSLVAITLGALSGTIQNWKMNSLKIETVSLLTFPAMLTTEIGVAIAKALPIIEFCCSPDNCNLADQLEKATSKRREKSSKN